MYSINNLTGNSPAIPTPAGASNVEMFTERPSMSMRTTDNNSLTITPTESVRQQLQNLPNEQQFEILRQIAMKKLQQESAERKMQASPSISSQHVQVDAPNYHPQNMLPMMNSETGPLLADVSMQQGVPNLPSTGTEVATSGIDTNMLQTYLGDATGGTTVSFDSIDGLSGELMQIGAVESIETTENNRRVDETLQAIQGLNNSAR